MKIICESTDPQEIKRVAKSLDMACFIFEIVNNSFRSYRRTGKSLDYDKVKEILHNELANYNIDIDDLLS